tara:strand:- start:88 stop:744 length:657 start_codon:yes stop_codon:yes gene_type:complete
MKTLELFAGSRSFSKEAEKLGYETYTTDINDFEKIDQVCNIFDFEPSKVPFIPNFIWASPPCYTFSVASIGHHWTGGKGAYIPKTKEAVIGIKIAQKTKEIIDYYKSINPNLLYLVENPRGVLRKLDIFPEEELKTAWYCQYGDTRAKPTDLWTNFDWKPKTCKNGNPDCDHERAPRGSRTGTQGLKGNYERSIVPADLCKKIISKVEVHLFTLRHGK